MADPRDRTTPTTRTTGELNQTKELPVLALPPDPTEEIYLPAERFEVVREPRAPRAAGARGGRGRRAAAGLLLAVVGIGLGVGASVLIGRQTSSGPFASRPGAGAVVAPVSVTGLDAKAGGSGFAKAGTGWRTQTYTTAAFGGLKSGVGLVLDLGTARGLSSVSLDVGTSPLTVELRAADAKPTGDGGATTVAAPRSASGPVTLDASAGGEHRYWIVWVSRLGERDGGFGATVGTPVAKG